jgi:hypothetical protein
MTTGSHCITQGKSRNFWVLIHPNDLLSALQYHLSPTLCTKDYLLAACGIISLKLHTYRLCKGKACETLISQKWAHVG